MADDGPGRTTRLAWGAVVLILLGVVGLVTYALTHVSSPTAPVLPAVTSPAVLATLSAVPTSTFDQVGVTATGTELTAPVVLSGQPPLTVDGKPEVLFVGAEYCPFCAAERWPLVVALARFGKFTALHDANSSAQSVFPSTATFSFVGVAYSSRWVALTGVELFSDQAGPNGAFRRLARLTPAQAALVARTAPLAGGLSAGGTPFLDVAGRIATTTAGFSPALLAGESQAQIAAAVASPGPTTPAGSTGSTSPPVGQAVLATANQLSAGICAATGQQPASVCSSKGVLAADTALGLTRPAASAAD
jgi:hypothetical protein